MNHNWYATITAKVLLDKDLTDKQKILIAVISNLQNEKGYCFSSNKYLSECLNCSEVTLRQNLRFLEEKNYIGRVIKLNENREVEYRTLTVLENPTPLMVNNTTPDEKQSLTPDGKSSHNNKLIKTNDIYKFDFFWNLYPNKTAKKRCQQKWNILSETDKKNIFKTLPNFLKNKPFANYNFPNPFTYLNQERWMDEISDKIVYDEQLSDKTEDIGDLYAELRGY